MFERFTERAREVVVLAQQEARTLKHNYIGTEHVLLGLLREEEGLAARVLEALGITLEGVRTQVVRIVGSGEEVTSGQIPFTPRAKKVLELALREALGLGHNYIGTEHILLGLVRENEGVAARVLLDFDADAEAVRTAVIELLADPDYRPPAEPPVSRLASHVGARRPPRSDWPGDISWLMRAIAAEIRDELGRAPDSGDLLVLLACAEGTAAGRTLAALGISTDTLWATLERERREASRVRDRLTAELAAAREAKESAIESSDFEAASRQRDIERELTERLRRAEVAGPQALTAARHRLGLPTPPDPRNA